MFRGHIFNVAGYEASIPRLPEYEDSSLVYSEPSNITGSDLDVDKRGPALARHNDLSNAVLKGLIIGASNALFDTPTMHNPDNEDQLIAGYAITVHRINRRAKDAKRVGTIVSAQWRAIEKSSLLASQSDSVIPKFAVSLEELIAQL